MGTQYPSVSVSGFNASPPPDNGSTGADNQIGWSKHIGKIGTPLKTAIEAVNSALVTALDQSTRLIFVSDSTIAGDHNRTVQISSAVTSSITVSLGDAATMAAGYTVSVANQSAVACVVGRASGGDTINGTAGDVAIAPLDAMTFRVNSAETGYLILSRSAAAAGKADQEAATSASLVVTPSQQHSHPSAAKAWCVANTSGSILASYNITGVTDGGAGLLTITLDTDFSSANWAALVTAFASTATDSSVEVSAQAAGTVNIRYKGAGGVLDPSTGYLFAGFGDQ